MTNDWTTRWQEETWGGRPCKIYQEFDNYNDYIHGAILIGDKWYSNVWTKDGRCTSLRTGIHDLLPVQRPEPIVLEWEGEAMTVNHAFRLHRDKIVCLCLVFPEGVSCAEDGKRFRIRAEQIE